MHVIDTNDKEKSCFIDDEFEVCKDQIELFEILGEGAFGMVKKGRYNGEIVAVKTLKGAYFKTINGTYAYKNSIS